MALPTFTMRQLLEAGVHFGHHTRRWNPKMAPYLFGARNGIHIIDLQKAVPLLHRGLQAARDVAAGGGRILFVGSKRQASERVAEAAKRCGQYYVNHRWLGGMLTNWQTISRSIRRLREMDEKLADENIGLTKKEMLRLIRERDKLERALGGIKEMGGLPDILFVIDTIKEAIAVREASKLGIPVIAVVDSNSNPEGITYPIPGNDDAMRAIDLYCRLVSDAVLDGLQEEMIAAGVDIGEAEEAPAEAAAAAAPEPGAKPVPRGEPVEEAKPAEAPAAEAEPAAAAAAEEAKPVEAPAAEAEPAAAAAVEEAEPAQAPAVAAEAPEAAAGIEPAEAPGKEAKAAEEAAAAPAEEAETTEEGKPAKKKAAAKKPVRKFLERLRKAKAPAKEAAGAAKTPKAKVPAKEAAGAAKTPKAKVPAKEAAGAAKTPKAKAPAKEAAGAAKTPKAKAPRKKRAKAETDSDSDTETETGKGETAGE